MYTVDCKLTENVTTMFPVEGRMLPEYSVNMPRFTIAEIHVWDGKANAEIQAIDTQTRYIRPTS